MTDEAEVRAAFVQQAGWCRALGSPFTGLLMELASERLDRGSPAGARILDWPGRPDARFDALPLRLAGGLHALARRGHALAAAYPPYETDPATLWSAVTPVLHDPALLPWLDSPPQTNEVARSAILMAGLRLVAGETGLPLALFELGSSAGLNLVLDRYAYRLGPVEAGVPGSPLLLAPEWRGAAPQGAPVTVVARRGADLNPLDVTDAADRERLMAYVWPDQTARLARIQAAIDLARAEPPPLDKAEAADWTEQVIAPAPQDRVTRVLMHSIAFQYFPEASQARIRAHLDRVSRAATATAPLAWLRFEVDARYPGSPSLLLTSWPGGLERRLASGSPHGVWVEWLSESTVATIMS